MFQEAILMASNIFTTVKLAPVLSVFWAAIRPIGGWEISHPKAQQIFLVPITLNLQTRP
jgi:hypothetical protein